MQNLLCLASLAVSVFTTVAGHGYMMGIGLMDGPTPVEPMCRGCSANLDNAVYRPVNSSSVAKCGWDNLGPRQETITANAGDTIQFVSSIVVGHQGAAAFYLSLDNGDSWSVLSMVLDMHCTQFTKDGIYDNTVPIPWDLRGKFELTLPKGLPSSDKAIIRWEWINNEADEIYIKCFDIKIKGQGKAAAIPAPFPIQALSGNRLSHIPGWHSATSPHLYDKYTKGVKYLDQVPTIASVYNAYLNIFGGHKIASWDGTFAKNGRSINLKTGEQQPKLHDVSMDILFSDISASTTLPNNATSTVVPDEAASIAVPNNATSVVVPAQTSNLVLPDGATSVVVPNSPATKTSSPLTTGSTSAQVASSSAGPSPSPVTGLLTTQAASSAPTVSPIASAQPKKAKKCRVIT